MFTKNVKTRRWMLDGKFVNDKGFTYNKRHDVIIFKMTEKVFGTTTVQWKIIVAHSTVAVGNLYCRAQYSTGKERNSELGFIKNKSILKWKHVS